MVIDYNQMQDYYVNYFLRWLINSWLNNSINYYHNIINIMINLHEFVFIRENSYSHMYYFMYRNNITIKETKV